MTEPFYLDIGGKKYKTTKDTLVKIPYFQTFFERWDNRKNDKHHTLFIDQDAEDFRHILKWARNPNYEIPLDVEIGFWGLDEGIKAKEMVVEKEKQRRCYKCGKKYGEDDIGKRCCSQHVANYAKNHYPWCIICGSHCRNSWKTNCVHRNDPL